MWRTLLTRRPGQAGTKRLLREYGSRLVAVRYRYDPDRGERMKTIELAIETVAWKPKSPVPPPTHLEIRLRPPEDLLRRALLLAQCRYDIDTDTRSVPVEVARSLGLADRAERSRSASSRMGSNVDRRMRK